MYLLDEWCSTILSELGCTWFLVRKIAFESVSLNAHVSGVFSLDLRRSMKLTNVLNGLRLGSDWIVDSITERTETNWRRKRLRRAPLKWIYYSAVSSGVTETLRARRIALNKWAATLVHEKSKTSTESESMDFYCVKTADCVWGRVDVEPTSVGAHTPYQSGWFSLFCGCITTTRSQNSWARLNLVIP